MRINSSLFFFAPALAMLLLSGCVAPGYPYTGCAPYGTVVPSGGVPAVPVPGVPVAAPAYPYSYVYAPAPVLIAPTFYAGFGTGYWYGGHYWPYRSGCAFYGGRYYGGYHANYWHGGNGNWHGGCHGGNWHR